jgi:hypothetical protein
MSYTFLQEQGEESSAASFSDIPAYVLSKLNLTAERSCSNGNGMGSCPSSRYGTTSEPSMESRGGESQTCCAREFHVRGSAQPAEEADSSTKTITMPSDESFASRALQRFSWKTRQCSLFGGLMPFCGIWPKWGSMRNGACSGVTTPIKTACEKGCSYLPAAQASDGQKWYVVKPTSAKRRYSDGRQEMVIHAVAAAKGFPAWNRYVANPPFWEALMGWPIGWTDLRPLATDKIQQWLNSHGKHSVEGRS